MTWQLAISLSILTGVITALVQRHYSQKSTAPATFPPAISYLLGVTPLGIIVGLSLSHHVHWTWWILLLLVCNSSLVAFGNWLLFKAVKRLSVGQFQIINQFYEIVVITLGWIFLHEGLSISQVLGAGLLFGAALLAIRASVPSLGNTHRKVHLRSVTLTLVGAALFGTSLVIEKAALGLMDLGAWLIFGWGAQTLAMLLLALKDVSKKTLKNFGLSEIKWSAFMGWANAASGVLYAVALVRSNNISLVTSLSAIALPLIAIAAYFILKEREKLGLLWTSVALAVLGLVITAIR